jgi:serine/threonine protein kinase
MLPSVSGTTRLRFIRTLAEGGMGRVDLVLRKQGVFQRLVALKRPRPAYTDDPEFRAMFLQEARLAGLLRHPNIAAVQEVGEDAEGPYLVMDYVEGVTAGTLAAFGAGDRRLPVQIAIEVVRQAAEGLHAAHELTDPRGKPLGLIHRDVSPQNLLVGFDGIVRVSDFGIAKAMGGGARTSTGVLKGKIGYMAPEQLGFHEMDRRADLFSLGVVLFELLTGRRLYKDADARITARRILDEPPPDIDEFRDDVHPALVELLFELLAKRPDKRPADAAIVARRLAAMNQELAIEEGAKRLDDFVSTEFASVAATVRAEVASVTVTGEAPPKKRRWHVPAIALGVAVLVGIAVAAGWSAGEDPPAARMTGPSAAAPAREVARAREEPVAAPSMESAPIAVEPRDEPAEPRRVERARLRRAAARMEAAMESGSGLDRSTWSWE